MRLSTKAKKNFKEDNEFYIHIGQRIKQARKERQIYIENLDKNIDAKGYFIKKPASQVMVAKALNTTFQQIGKYEKGENRIPVVNLIRIAKFLNKPLDFFIDIEKEKMVDHFMSRLDKVNQ